MAKLNLALIAVSLTLGACAMRSAPADEALSGEKGTTAMSDACPVLDSRNWHAWIDRMPSTDAASARLLISGQIDLPKPGYEISWRPGIADRMMPPGQQMILELKEPDGIVAQVVTTEDVSYQGPALSERYRFIEIRCGDKIIAELPDVMLTD